MFFFLTRTSVFVIGFVILCFVYYLVVVWSSVPTQLISWKVPSQNIHVSSGTLNSTHLQLTFWLRTVVQ